MPLKNEKRPTKRQRRKALQELAKRKQRSSRLNLSLLHERQREFLRSKEKFVAACCSRRAGKSYAIAFRLLQAALKYPGSIVPYITLTRDSAKLIIWPPLRELGIAANIPLQFKANNGDVVLPNGSRIILRGIEDRKQAEKLRGPKYPAAVVDEAQGVPSYLREVIFEVLEPACFDYEDSQIYLTGTPNASCVGVFHDICVGEMEGWDVHSWTLRDNAPLLRGRNADAYIADQARRRNLPVSDPAIQREWFGKWVRDTESTIYKYLPSRNDIGRKEWEELRDSVDDWEYTLGLDLGWNDPSAFVVAASSAKAGRFVIVDTYKESEMTTDALARKIGDLFAIYGDMRVIADTGGYGKGPTEELSRVYNIPVEAAEKVKKSTFVEFMNSDLKSGAIRILVPTCAELAEEWSLLLPDSKALDKGIFKEDSAFHNHLCDAALYNWRLSYHQEGIHEFVPPAHGSKEFYEARAIELEQAAIEYVKRREDPELMREDWLDSLM